MPAAIVTIIDEPGGLIITGSGKGWEPGDGSLCERLSIAAVKAIDEEMKKLEASGHYSKPMVQRDPRIDPTVFEDADPLAPEGPPDYWE